MGLCEITRAYSLMEELNLHVYSLCLNPCLAKILKCENAGRRFQPGIPGIVKLREVPLTAVVVTHLTALPVPRGGQEVGGGGLIYRYSVPPGHHRAGARGTR